jgi:hypothetical protein
VTTTTTVTPSSKGRALRGILKKKEQIEVPTQTIYDDLNEFNDGKEWYMDFYKLFWDEDLDENLY